MNFWTKLTQKGYFRSIKEKKNQNYHLIIHIRITYRVLNFSFKKNKIFWNKFFPQKILPVKNEQYHKILHIRISLSTKFQLKLTILIFWTNFTWKRCFWSKKEKVKIANELWIFELVYVTNLSLKWRFWFFGSNLPKRGIFGQD